MLLNFSGVLCMVSLMLVFTSCEEKETSTDPAGTVTIKMMNCGNGCTQAHLGGSSSYFVIDADNNFYGDAYSSWQFVSVGEVKRLADVKAIPKSAEWTESVAVKSGNGYIGKWKKYGDIDGYWAVIDSTYVRIYVTSWIEGSPGNIIGAEIKHQSPFKL